MCSAKMVHAFTVSSFVRGRHKYRDVWNAPNDRAYFLVKENQVIQEIYRLHHSLTLSPDARLAVAVIEQSPSGKLTRAGPCPCMFLTNFSYLLGIHLSW